MLFMKVLHPKNSPALGMVIITRSFCSYQGLFQTYTDVWFIGCKMLLHVSHRYYVCSEQTEGRAFVWNAKI